MTRQTVDELHEDNTRVRADVVARAREFTDNHDVTWGFEYEIPAETNGWVYTGDHGVAATMASWANQFPDATSGVCAMVHPTHPQNESRTYATATYVADMDEKVASKEEIARFDGRPYRTPLYVRRQIFWQAVDAAIEWMENNQADDD